MASTVGTSLKLKKLPVNNYVLINQLKNDATRYTCASEFYSNLCKFLYNLCSVCI